MAQCESNVFFPDNPSQAPQFSDCPRQAETTRRTWRFGVAAKGEARIVIVVARLCAKCAREWDAHPEEEKIHAARASGRVAAF
jgi:hypothetical protein